MNDNFYVSITEDVSRTSSSFNNKRHSDGLVLSCQYQSLSVCQTSLVLSRKRSLDWTHTAGLLWDFSLSYFRVVWLVCYWSPIGLISSLVTLLQRNPGNPSLDESNLLWHREDCRLMLDLFLPLFVWFSWFLQRGKPYNPRCEWKVSIWSKDICVMPFSIFLAFTLLDTYYLWKDEQYKTLDQRLSSMFTESWLEMIAIQIQIQTSECIFRSQALPGHLFFPFFLKNLLCVCNTIHYTKHS